MLFKKRFTKSQLTTAKVGFVFAFVGVSLCIVLFKLRGKVKGIQLATPLSWTDVVSIMPYILLAGFIAGLITYFVLLLEKSNDKK